MNDTKPPQVDYVADETAVAALLGRWRVERIEFDGGEDTREGLEIAWEFRPDELERVFRDEGRQRYRYWIEPETSPMQIKFEFLGDSRMSRGQLKDIRKHMQLDQLAFRDCGIYRFESPRLYVCYGWDTLTPPRSFQSTLHHRDRLVVLSRTE